MKVLTFGLDNRALLDIDGHSKRWNSRVGSYVDRLDVLVEMRQKGHYSEKNIADNVRIIPIYVPHPALYPFIAYRKALEEHKKYKYDLVTTEEPFRTGVAALLFKRETGVPISVEYHNDTFYNGDWLNERPISHRAYVIAGKHVVQAADSIRCVNYKNLEDLRRICNNDNDKLIEIIPVPTALYEHEKHHKKAQDIRQRVLQGKDGLIILFVGRLVPVKKVDELIKVFAELRSKYKHIYLDIVGDGFERKNLVMLANRLGNERIIFEGFVEEDEVLRYFGACDIFVNPAHIEPYGKVFIEAMSAEKPVVCTDGTGAVADGLCVHDLNSLVVSPGNLNDLKTSIIRLIEDENLRRKLGENARQAVMKKFDYEKSLKQMRDFWNRTIQHASRP